MKDRAIFRLYSLGVATNRDDWVYDFDDKRLIEKVRFLADRFNSALPLDDPGQFDDKTFKWTRSLKRRFVRKLPIQIDDAKTTTANYRPFAKMHLYYDDALNEMHNRTNEIFRAGAAQPTLDRRSRLIQFSGHVSENTLRPWPR